MLDVDEIYTVRCACSSAEHALFVHLIDDTVYLQIRMNPLPWYKRIVSAFQYLFGIERWYGDYEEAILDQSNIKDVKRLIKTLQKIK